MFVSFNHETGVLMHAMQRANIKAHSSVSRNGELKRKGVSEQLSLICKNVLLLKIYYSHSCLHIQLLNELCLIPSTSIKRSSWNKKP